MNLIDYDIRERRSLASASRYRKNGSKSKKCFLPSDSLSAAKIKKMNGDVKVYQIGKPISWQEFREYPTDMQKEYLTHFAEKFGCTRSMMAEMLGVNDNTFGVYCNNHNLTGILKRKAGAATKIEFARWLKQQSEPTTSDSEAKPETPAPTKPLPYFPNTLKEGSLHLEGTANTIFQTLFAIFQDSMLEVDFHFSILDQKQTGDDELDYLQSNEPD